MKRLFLLIILACGALFSNVEAQKFAAAYLDMQYILKNLPQYETANEQLTMISKRWQKEIDVAQQEVQILTSNYQTEQIFFVGGYEAEERERDFGKRTVCTRTQTQVFW